MLSVLFFSCKTNTATKLDNKTEAGMKGNWVIASVNYPGSDYIKVNSFEQFEEKVGKQRVEDFKERYNLFINTFKNALKPYKDSVNLTQDFKYDNTSLLKFYDEFNDGKSSQRIVDYLINIYN